jgi:hypothetical protein
MTGKRTQVKHNNFYDPLLNELGCYTYHNYGHKAADCRLQNYESDLNPSIESVKVWRKKENDKCVLVLSAQRQKNPWYIDSGCSKHMMGDKSKFMSLSERKSENVTLEMMLQVKLRVNGW